MTLDIKKYLVNLIKKEAKISHFQVKVDAGKAGKLKGQFAAAIRAEFGESYLQDADYILFFEKDEAWTDADVKKLFELVNRALGKDANMLAQSDFKKLSAGSAEEDASSEDAEDGAEDAEQTPTESVDDNALFLKITLKWAC